MVEVAAAFFGCELVEQSPAGAPQRIDRPLLRGTQQVFELREHRLDRIQIGTVGREIPQLGIGSFDRFTHTSHLVCREVVHHDNLSAGECGNQLLADIRQKEWSVDRPINHQRSGESRRPQRGQKGGRLPVPPGNMVVHSLAREAASPQTGHIRFGPGFVEEHESVRVESALLHTPEGTLLGYVRTLLFAGPQDFF